jgi:hypothetical protein
MNIPGFTAEASLYRDSGQYQMAGAHTHADGAIQPAISRSNCYWDCMASCDDLAYYCSVNCSCFCKGGPPRCQYQ